MKQKHWTPKRGDRYGDRVWDGYKFISEAEWAAVQLRLEALKAGSS